MNAAILRIARALRAPLLALVFSLAVTSAILLLGGHQPGVAGTGADEVDDAGTCSSRRLGRGSVG